MTAIANPINREYLWAHAFAYADRYAPTMDACAYATHYADFACDAEKDHYPDHSPTFAEWRREHDGRLVHFYNGWRVERWGEGREKYYAVVTPDGLRLTTTRTIKAADQLISEITHFIGPVDGRRGGQIKELIRDAKLVPYIRNCHETRPMTYAAFQADTLGADLKPFPPAERIC